MHSSYHRSTALETRVCLSSLGSRTDYPSLRVLRDNSTDPSIENPRSCIAWCVKVIEVTGRVWDLVLDLSEVNRQTDTYINNLVFLRAHSWQIGFEELTTANVMY